VGPDVGQAAVEPLTVFARGRRGADVRRVPERQQAGTMRAC